MPAYAAGNAPALTVGDRVILVNGATEANVTKTQAVAIAQIAGTSADSTVALHNGTNQAMTVTVADVDADANYRALTDANTGIAITCASGSSIVFSTVGPFLRCEGTAPTSGVLAITR